MTASLDRLQQVLRRLPGLGYRSAERIALHLIMEQPDRCTELVEALQSAVKSTTRCSICGNVCDAAPDGTSPRCEVCADAARNAAIVCVVESVPDLMAIEKSAAFRGVYHVLHGKLSPIKGIGADVLNLKTLRDRVTGGTVAELILALGNDIESEATCHYIQDRICADTNVKVSRIGFGLPSGAGIGYADSVTLKSAMDARRSM